MSRACKLDSPHLIFASPSSVSLILDLTQTHSSPPQTSHSCPPFFAHAHHRYNCLRAEIRAMAGNPGSAIVNAASVAGLMGSSGAAPYCASKHAVIGLTRTAAKEVGNKKIRVNAIAP